MDHDLIIIGGGAGGLGAARTAVWAKADVLLVNDGPIGGDCTFTGCVPSKTLIAAGKDGLDFTAAMKRVAAAVDEIAATETADVLRSEGIGVVEGRARLVADDAIEVGSRRITAPRIIVATGGRPFVPPIRGIDGVEVLTNETVFELREAPRSLGIIGGGPIGCEMAQAFCKLGVPVVLFEAEDRLLTKEEPEAGGIIAAALMDAGVDVRTGQRIESVEPASDRGVRVHTPSGATEVEHLLVAVGRLPNTADLGLEERGIELDQRGHVVTDNRLATAVKSVYAVGDVTGKLAFTHAAYEMGRLATGNALGKGLRGAFHPKWTPWVTFTDPEVARVGMTEAEAASHGGRVAYLPLTEMDRAITDGRTDGYIKLIAGPRRVLRRVAGGQMIGATIVAPRGGEMIHEAVLAMRTRMFTARLAQTVHAYPTWSHGIRKTAAQFFGDVAGRRARPARRS